MFFHNNTLCKERSVAEIFSLLPFIGLCFISVDTDDETYITGEFDRSKPEFHEQRFEVQRVFIHPKFNRDKVTYDIALLKLKTVEKRTSYVNAVRIEWFSKKFLWFAKKVLCC